jgi:hypothetical protein
MLKDHPGDMLVVKRLRALLAAAPMKKEVNHGHFFLDFKNNPIDPFLFENKPAGSRGASVQSIED